MLVLSQGEQTYRMTLLLSMSGMLEAYLAADWAFPLQQCTYLADIARQLMARTEVDLELWIHMNQQTGLRNFIS